MIDIDLVICDGLETGDEKVNKVTNISDKEVSVNMSGCHVMLEPQDSVKVNLDDVINRREIANSIRVDEDLTEINPHKGNVLYG